MKGNLRLFCLAAIVGVLIACCACAQAAGNSRPFVTIAEFREEIEEGWRNTYQV